MLFFGKVTKTYKNNRVDVEMANGAPVDGCILCVSGGFGAVQTQAMPQAGDQVLIARVDDDYVVLGAIAVDTYDAAGETNEAVVKARTVGAIVEASIFAKGGCIGAELEERVEIKCDDVVLGSMSDNAAAVRADKLTQTLNAFIAKFNAHTHTLTGSAAAPTGAAAVTGTALPTASTAQTTTVSDVSTGRVKVS